MNIRGHRVGVAEMEHALLKLKDINECVVLCYKPLEDDHVSVTN